MALFAVGMLAAVLLQLLLILTTSAIICKNCLNFQGAFCLTTENCQSNFCLFEQIRYSNGLFKTSKRCLSEPIYQFDDGSATVALNQCVQKFTTLASYMVKICNDFNECNDQCYPFLPPESTTLPTPPYPFVECYLCSSSLADCNWGACRGKYCYYMEKQDAVGQKYWSKGCTENLQLTLDDGTQVITENYCEKRTTSYGTTYTTKICDDSSYCNSACDLNVPLRQPRVSCYVCSGADDCVSGTTCQAQYCYQLSQYYPATDTTMVTKGCTNSISIPSAPTSAPSPLLNSCQKSDSGGADMAALVCDSGDYCNRGCVSGNIAGQGLFTCTLCRASNVADCTGSLCYGRYCIYEYQESSASSVVQKSCSNSSLLLFEDGSQYTGNGSCQSKTSNGVTFTVKLCNSSNCNSACPNSQPQTSYSSANVQTITFASLLTILTFS